MISEAENKVQENIVTIKDEGVDNVPGKATQALLMKKGPKKKQKYMSTTISQSPFFYLFPLSSTNL